MAFHQVTSQSQVPFYIELEFCSKVQPPPVSDDDDEEEEGCTSQDQVRLVHGQTLAIASQSKTQTEFGSAENSPIAPGRFAPVHSR